MNAPRPSLLTRLLIAPIRLYQLFISPFLGNRCRYYPSCSAYSLDAIQTHGPVRGLFLGFQRLSRCHPWAEGGYDPVPEVTNPTHKEDR